MELAVRTLLDRLRIAYQNDWRRRFEVDGNREETRARIEAAVVQYAEALEKHRFKLDDVVLVMPVIRRYHSRWIPKPWMVVHHLKDARRWEEKQRAWKAQQHRAPVTTDEVRRHRAKARQIAGLEDAEITRGEHETGGL